MVLAEVGDGFLRIRICAQRHHALEIVHHCELALALRCLDVINRKHLHVTVRLLLPVLVDARHAFLHDIGCIFGRAIGDCCRDEIVLAVDRMLYRLFVLFIRETSRETGTADEQGVHDQRAPELSFDACVCRALLCSTRLSHVNEILDVVRKVLFVARSRPHLEIGLRSCRNAGRIGIHRRVPTLVWRRRRLRVTRIRPLAACQQACADNTNYQSGSHQFAFSVFL